MLRNRIVLATILISGTIATQAIIANYILYINHMHADKERLLVSSIGGAVNPLKTKCIHRR
jgi:hypothetical protein